MTPADFIEQLRQRCGGEIDDERPAGDPHYAFSRKDDPTRQPRLYCQMGTRSVKFDFIIAEEVALGVYVPPPMRLLLRERTLFERLLGAIGLCPSIVTGRKELDDRYVIQNLPEGQGPVLLTDAFIAHLEALAPFATFEMTAQAYRVLKEVDINGIYTVDRAIADLEALTRLVDHCDQLPRFPPVPESRPPSA